MAAFPETTPALEELRERLDVLFWREAASYKTEDYLAEANANLRRWREEAPDGSREHQGETITAYWREVICEWAYNLVDHFDISRDRIAVFTNLLDRQLYHHVTTHSEPIQKADFQLLAVTCLYLAIKLESGHRQMFTMDLMIHLSRGKFSKEQMAQCERDILNGLQWKVHPPTNHVFLRQFLLLLQCKAQDHHYQLLESAGFFLELSALDYHFVTETPSRVALAALLNAIQEGADKHVHCPSHYQSYHQYEDQIQRLIDNSHPRERQAVERCRLRLHAVFGHTDTGLSVSGLNHYHNSGTASPRSVML